MITAIHTKEELTEGEILSEGQRNRNDEKAQMIKKYNYKIKLKMIKIKVFFQLNKYNYKIKGKFIGDDLIL